MKTQFEAIRLDRSFEFKEHFETNRLTVMLTLARFLKKTNWLYLKFYEGFDDLCSCQMLPCQFANVLLKMFS
jgi:hypothetical protein